MKKASFKLLKFSIAAAIIAYLVGAAWSDGTFERLGEQPKRWGLLAAACAAYLAGMVLSFVRWYLLVRALGLRFTIKNACRLGFVGYVLNLISLGAVGGDLFRAVFLAREQIGYRTEAVATVVLDRAVGLFMLFVMASVAILLTGQLRSPVPEMQVISQGTLACTAVAALGIVVLQIPSLAAPGVSGILKRLPRLGVALRRLLGAINMYRNRPAVLVQSAALSLVAHTFCTLSIFWIARGLPGTSPSLTEHFAIVPLTMVTGVVPLPLNGLGVFEYAMNSLYQWVPSGTAVPIGRGFVVALGYRAITIVAAVIGASHYVTSRSEVDQVLERAELVVTAEG